MSSGVCSEPQFQGQGFGGAGAGGFNGVCVFIPQACRPAPLSGLFSCGKGKSPVAQNPTSRRAFTRFGGVSRSGVKQDVGVNEGEHSRHKCSRGWVARPRSRSDWRAIRRRSESRELDAPSLPNHCCRRRNPPVWPATPFVPPQAVASPLPQSVPAFAWPNIRVAEPFWQFNADTREANHDFSRCRPADPRLTSLRDSIGEQSR